MSGTVGDAESRTVRIYKNLHKSRALGRPVYSIKDRRSGLVIGHSDRVVLADARFVVSQAGRQRVLAERSRNVHAYVEGCLREELGAVVGDGDGVTYNPYRCGAFTAVATGQPLAGADTVVLAERVTAWGIKPQ